MSQHLPHHLPYWLAAAHASLNPHTCLQWLTHLPTIQHVFHATCDELAALGITPAQIHRIHHPDWPRIEESLRWAQVPNHHLITYTDPAYPPLLREIHAPPLLLFVRGEKAALTKVQIAMVGSRNATYAGMKTAENFAKQLAANGVAITSGLARGIDALSHRGALAVQGTTIAVAGTGHHHIYPPSNRELANSIIENQGALVSELPLDTPPRAANFPQRNRIISGLSRGVLLVEAALKSGSLITARLALDQGRDVFAIPGSIHQPHAKGCHYLIRQGAKLVETADDILEEISSLINFNKKSNTCKPVAPLKLNRNQTRVFLQITHDITPIDVIILRSGLTAGEVSSILLTLELDGHIQSVSGGYVRTLADQ